MLCWIELGCESNSILSQATDVHHCGAEHCFIKSLSFFDFHIFYSQNCFLEDISNFSSQIPSFVENL